MSSAHQLDRAPVESRGGLTLLLHEIRHTPLLWLLVFVPVVFVAQAVKP